MKTAPKTEQNAGQRKRTSRTARLAEPGNTYPHAPDANIRPVSHITSPFTNIPPLVGTAQAILLRLAHLEAHLALNLISNFTSGNHSGYGNPYVHLCLLQAAASQRPPFLYQPPNVAALSHLLHGRNVHTITRMANPPAVTGTMMSSVTEVSSVVANKESCIKAQGNLQTQQVIQKTTIGPRLTSNSPVLQPTSKERLHRPNTKHYDQKFSSKLSSSQCKTIPSIKASTLTSPNRQVWSTLSSSREEESKQQAMQHLHSEHLTKALASLGLSLEDLELLSHCPDDHLTTEMLPLIIQDMQQRKRTKAIIHSSPQSNMPGRVVEYGHTSRTSSDQVEVSTFGAKSSCTYMKHHTPVYKKIRHHKTQEDHLVSQSVSSPSSSSSNSPALHSSYSHTHNSLRSRRFGPSDVNHKNFSTQDNAFKRDSLGRTSNFSVKGRKHGNSKVSRRPGSVYIPFPSISDNFVSPEHNKRKTYATQRLSSHSRSTTYNAMKKCHDQLSFSSQTSETTTESRNIQTTVNRETAKPSTQTWGVIRVSGIPPDHSERDLMKMAAPFGQPVEVLMATEVDMVTRLERKKALTMLPSEVSAREMVKVYSAIPPHMRQQNLELMSQTVDLTSPVSVFHAFVGPSNGLFAPVERLMVVRNVPPHPSAPTGVLRILKPFGKVFRTLVFCGNKVGVEPCPGNNDCVQMVLEMESAAVVLSVYEWSQKIPCIYQNNHLSFIRGSDAHKNTQSS